MHSYQNKNKNNAEAVDLLFEGFVLNKTFNRHSPVLSSWFARNNIIMSKAAKKNLHFT